MTKHGFLATVSVVAVSTLFAFSGLGATKAPFGRGMTAEAKSADKHSHKGGEPEGKQSDSARSSDSSAKGGAAAANAKLHYEGPPVMAPDNFSGMAAVGYASAKAAPEVMAKLFCYCGCDATESHSRLIDCFTSNHGVDCHICQEEAVLALKLYRQGVPIAEIQKQVDEGYAHHYPFQEDTETFKKYKASRLWTGGGENTVQAVPVTNVSEHKEPAGPLPEGDACVVKPGTKSAAKPKVKPGFHVGNCCGGNEDHK